MFQKDGNESEMVCSLFDVLFRISITVRTTFHNSPAVAALSWENEIIMCMYQTYVLNMLDIVPKLEYNIF